MKNSRIFTEQCNLKIDKELKEDILYLSASGVNVPSLIRPVICETIKKTKKELEKRNRANSDANKFSA